MKQNHEVRIKMTKEELEKIQRKAEACGLTSSAYLRMIGLKSQVEIQ